MYAIRSYYADFVRGIYWIIDKNKGGIYNFVAPAQVDYRSFIFSLAATLNNPVKIRIPALFFRVFVITSYSIHYTKLYESIYRKKI